MYKNQDENKTKLLQVHYTVLDYFIILIQHKIHDAE